MVSHERQGAPGRLMGDACDRDWIWDREVETASTEETLALAPEGSKDAELDSVGKVLFRVCADPGCRLAGRETGQCRSHSGRRQGLGSIWQVARASGVGPNSS